MRFGPSSATSRSAVAALLASCPKRGFASSKVTDGSRRTPGARPAPEVPICGVAPARSNTGRDTWSQFFRSVDGSAVWRSAHR
jgi:hypothetical protein